MTTTPLHMQPLPEQPAIVRQWIEVRNRETRSVNRALADAVRGYGDDNVAEELAAYLTGGTMPADVRSAYRAWADQWNVIVAARKAERQARANARQLAKLKEGTCPVCTMIHPGEC